MPSALAWYVYRAQLQHEPHMHVVMRAPHGTRSAYGLACACAGGLHGYGGLLAARGGVGGGRGSNRAQAPAFSFPFQQAYLLMPICRSAANTTLSAL